MEELILIVAVALMALVAMSQCAHHSSRRHETSHLPPARHDLLDVPRRASHAVTAERGPESAAGGTERDAAAGGVVPRR